MLVNFRPAFLPKRINIGKVGWLVSLQKKKGCEKLCGVSARNEFKKFLAGLLVKKLKDNHENKVGEKCIGSIFYQVKIDISTLEPNNQSIEL